MKSWNLAAFPGAPRPWLGYYRHLRSSLLDFKQSPLQVKARDISLLHDTHVIILQSDSLQLWALQEQQYLDDISLGRYISDMSHTRLSSSSNVAFVLDGPNVVPFTVLNSGMIPSVV